jgi:hypothetical protein
VVAERRRRRPGGRPQALDAGARPLFYTNKGAIILDGSQYSLASQLRLRLGVFTRLEEDGELGSHVDVMPGQGVSHAVHLDPSRA